jgi:hypothetical protein
MNGRPRADIDELAFRRDWDLGLTLAELAALYGVSPSTITNYSVRFRCKPRTPGRKNGSYTTDLSPRELVHGEWVTDRLGVQRWESA